MSTRAIINCPHCPHCPHCKGEIKIYKNPAPTVDAIIYDSKQGLLLIERRLEPLGWALPGGFVDYAETLAQATIREAKEETGLNVEIEALVGVYSNPLRDPRRHTITTAFWCKCASLQPLRAGDDAAKAKFFPLAQLPENIVFDHRLIIQDFLKVMQENAHAAWR